MNQLKKANHPIIIGIGQVTHRERIIGDSLSALDLAAKAIHACVEDTGCEDILKHVDSLSVVNISTESMNYPEERLCRMLGISPAVRELSAIGGNTPQWLVNRAADKLASGEIKMALLVGGEAIYRDKNLREIYANGFWDDVLHDLQFKPSVVGDARLGSTPHENLYELDHARNAYPLFENALRDRLGMSLSEHRRFMSDYFKALAKAAEGNPLAWFNQGKKTDGDVTVPTEKNPIFNFPYTKYMNPNPAVNQAAALLVTDTETARKLSVPLDKWVYIHGGAESHDKWFLSERMNFYSSPAIRMNVEESLHYAGLTLPDISFYDLYSCFPCAVTIAALEIGLDLDHLPPLSITGGLPYFGGPGSNYAMHSIAHAVMRLRKNREQYGLVTALGWYLTKHAVGIYSGMEPKKVWDRTSMKPIQDAIDAMPTHAFCEKPNGPLTIETYTVLHDVDKQGPTAVIAGKLDSGERCLATSGKDYELAFRMENEEFLGVRGFVRTSDEGKNLFRAI